MRLMPSSRATAVAWSGPAPPSGTSVNLRGSKPWRMETRRMPSATWAFITRWMPSAAGATSMPSGWAIRRALGTQPEAAAREVVGIDIAEHDRGVGHRRLLAAAVVAGRAGLGAGGLRPDPQPARAVDPGDAAAAGADGVDVDHRHPHDIGVDLALRADQRLAFAHQGDVAARAADVDGDD